MNTLGGQLFFLVLIIVMVIAAWPTRDKYYSKGCPRCPNCGSKKKVRRRVTGEMGNWTHFWCTKCGHKW